MEFHYDSSSIETRNKITIMHLDDDMIARKVLSMGLLKKLDVNLISADDAINALKFLHENPIDLLIQDHIRPNMNGLELLSIIREDKELKQLPVIFLTDGFASEEGYKRAKELNAQIVKKPMIEAQTLIDAIAIACNNNPKKLIYK